MHSGELRFAIENALSFGQVWHNVSSYQPNVVSGLFSDAPLRDACKLAGLPKPLTCL
ncbi:MAG: hypothetical protein EXR80_06425 [Methylococcales bacterium]|nr:hypothetical protein [Methylococcales bacterium]